MHFIFQFIASYTFVRHLIPRDGPLAVSQCCILIPEFRKLVPSVNTEKSDICICPRILTKPGSHVESNMSWDVT